MVVVKQAHEKELMMMVLLFNLFVFYLQDFQIHQITKDTVWKVVDVVSCQIPKAHREEFEIQESCI